MIAELTAKLMDELDEKGVEGEIQAVLIVVEIDDGEDDLIRLKCSSDRGVVGSGLAHGALSLYTDALRADDDED